MPSPGPLISSPSPGNKPELPAKPDLKARRLIHSDVRKSLKLDPRESTLSPTKLRTAPPPPLPARKKPLGKLVNANGVSLKESTQEILAKKQQLLSASLILKAHQSNGGGKPLVPPKPIRPLSSYSPKENSNNLPVQDLSKSTLFTSFFNRISNLRRSFNRNEGPSSISLSHQDWATLFRDKSSSSSLEVYAGGLSNNTYAEIDESLHGRYLTIPKDVPIAPPRRKRPRHSSTLRRSLSFTDAHYIAQAVVEGDEGLIKELYPHFPCSEEPPIYAIVDHSRKKKYRRTIQEMSPYRRLDSGGSSRHPLYEESSPPERKQTATGLSELPSTLIVPDDSLSTPTHINSKRGEASKANNNSLDFYCPQEPPLAISPWNNKGSMHPNLIVESASFSSLSEHAKTPKYCPHQQPPSHHPYAQRARSQYTQDCNNAEIDRKRSANIGLTRSDDSFQAILDTADSSILQAESILSTLRITQEGDDEEEEEPFGREDAEEEEDVSSDIESNIRRLELTQAKINAALETFRQVQQRRRDESSTSLMTLETAANSPPLQKGRKKQRNNNHQKEHANHYFFKTTASGVSPKAEGQRNIRKGASHSTLVEQPVLGMDSNVGNNSSQVSGAGRSSRKPGLFRRHSFNLQYNSNNTPHRTASNGESTSSWYDEENNEGSSIGIHDTHESGGYSDSEGGGIRRRIRGLFGSFGKGGSSTNGSASSMFYTGGSSSSRQKPSEGGEEEVNSSDLFSQTVGEFTRRMESLNRCRPQEDEHAIPSKSSSSSQQTYSRLKYHAALAKNDSNESSSLGSSSHRHSVISTHSCSSYEQDDSEEEGNHPQNHPSSLSSSGPLDEDDEDEGGDPRRKKETQVFYIAREIMTSERVFVDVLHLLSIEFKEFIESKRRSGKKVIPDSDLSRIFSNLSELYALNKDLLVDFEERIRNWPSCPKIADVIVKKGPFLKLYTTYIREFSDVNLHFDECLSKYQKFAKIVKEFEGLERCRNLKIKHFLLKPVQRLPQYKLLLEDYLKHLDPVTSSDFDDTTNALRIVSEAAEHANDTIRQGDKFRRMLKLQSRLGDQELIRPGRELIKEGELQKISRKGIGPRYFILLSDVLLYATYSSSNRSDSSSLRVSYSIPLNSLSVRILPHYETEFSVSSPVRSCTLRASSVSERNDWIEALNHGIEEHRNRKATFLPGSNEIEMDQLDVVGNCAPVWIPDRRVTMCQNCTVEFSVLVRRHHCRACGKVVCASCSGNKAPLRYKGFEVGRVCDDCFDSLERELGHVENLRHRFKKRHSERNPSGISSGGIGSVIPHHSSSSTSGRYVPGRLKVRAVGEGAQMSGYLKRRIQKNGKWKRMWYVLKDRVLYAYKASEDTVATDTFPVLGFTLDTLSDKNFELYEGESADLVFQLTHPGSESLIFCAENDNVSEKWITALGEAVKLLSGPPETADLIEL